MSTVPLVWIVDDEEAVRDSLTILLECNGLTACSFASGEAMLTAAHACHGCLLLDIAMPDMDGFSVMAALRERDSQIPIIVVTGHGDALLERRVLDAGALFMLNSLSPKRPCLRPSAPLWPVPRHRAEASLS